MGADLRSRRRCAAAVIVVVAFAATAIERWQTRHQGLIYPDGYQYLLMARGIAAHLTPSVALGPGGDIFSPTVDAALKPLYPTIVAVVSAVTGVWTAAQLVTAASAGATVVLLATLTWVWSGSRLAALAAGLAAGASPMLGYWAGFIGPDPLAESLALACAVALLRRRAGLAGGLGGLCAAARPEWGVAMTALAVAGLVTPPHRERAGRALAVGALVLTVLVGVLRPPLRLPPGGATGLLGLLGSGIALQLLAGMAARRVSCRLVFVLGCVAGVAALALAERSVALRSVLSANWPLATIAVCGALAASREPWGGGVTTMLAVVAVPFAAYEYRNPASTRYLSELLPVLCLFGALALPVLARHLPTHQRALTAVAGTAVVATLLTPVLLNPDQPVIKRDYFQTMAAWLRRAPSGPLVTAAPDAFGFLLPDRTERALSPGAHGLILLDAAQREYETSHAATGRVVASYAPASGFERPDGTIDTGAARLVAGVVTR